MGRSRLPRDARRIRARWPAAPCLATSLNMHVSHPDFGDGRVISLTDEDGDQIVTVHFDSGDDRQFLAQFVVDKLRPI